MQTIPLNSPLFKRAVKQLIRDEEWDKVTVLLVSGFDKSTYYKKLNKSQKDNADDILDFAICFSSNYTDKAPHQWKIEDFDEIFLDLFPRKMSANAQFFKDIAPVMAAFFLYHQDTGYLSKGRNMAAYILKLAPEIEENANDKENWGMAKSALMENEKTTIWDYVVGILKLVVLILLAIIFTPIKLLIGISRKLRNLFGK